MCLLRVNNLIFVFFLLTGVKAAAQTGSISNPNNGRENNPYSKYGIGELNNRNNAVLRGMGSISSAYVNPYELNTENPASYSFIDRTTAEMGAMGSTRIIKTQDLSYTTGTASLSYFSLGFPVSKHAGMCFGFKPISHVYYSMADTLNNTSIGQVARAYSGEGSTNYAYVGGAWKYKGFSIGANVGYIFGNLQRITSTVPIDSAIVNRAYTAVFSNYNQIGGLYWKAGALYERKIDSDYTIRFGATFAMQQNLTQRLNSFQISSFDFRDTIVNDTLSYPGGQHGKLTMPVSYSVGVMISHNDKWQVGIDFSGTQWSGFKSNIDADLNTGIASQSYKLALGGDYTPDINNIRSYFSRVTYRAGFYYGSDYLNLAGTQLPNYGVTFGGSLPFRRSLSHLHLAFDIGRLGTTANNLLQQTYVRFTLGVSFNDRWFIKRKYD